MRDLAKTFVIVSVATLFGMTSIAQADDAPREKRARTSKAKAAAPATSISAVPWYEQGIEDLKPVSKSFAKARVVVEPARGTSGPRLVQRQTRATQAPSGLCQEGCDKTARNINMATLVLVKDAKASGKAKPAKKKAPKPHTRKPAVVASKK